MLTSCWPFAPALGRIFAAYLERPDVIALLAGPPPAAAPNDAAAAKPQLPAAAAAQDKNSRRRERRQQQRKLERQETRGQQQGQSDDESEQGQREGDRRHQQQDSSSGATPPKQQHAAHSGQAQQGRLPASVAWRGRGAEGQQQNPRGQQQLLGPLPVWAGGTHLGGAEPQAAVLQLPHLQQRGDRWGGQQLQGEGSIGAGLAQTPMLATAAGVLQSQQQGPLQQAARQVVVLLPAVAGERADVGPLPDGLEPEAACVHPAWQTAFPAHD